MGRRRIGIKALLLRTFLPAVAILALLLAVLVYQWLHAIILQQFDERLIAVSAISGAMVDPSDHDRLIAMAQAGGDPAVIEASDLYRRNVDPMRQIRTALGLTYLYTQVQGRPEEVVYILDSGDGEDHSPIGSADRLPAETMAGLRAVQQDGSLYISGVQYQDQWGLLKTAAAPFYRADGQIGGTAGADVNVSVLRVATQTILFQSALIGIASIMLCLLATFYIMRRVARPMEKLTQEALRLATGDYRPPAEFRAAREVSALRDSLAQMAQHGRQDQQQAMMDRADHRVRQSEQHLCRAHAAVVAPILLVTTATRDVMWLPTGAEAAPYGLAAQLEARAIARLAAKMAGNDPLIDAAELLVDGDHGALLSLWHDEQKLSLSGSVPLMLMMAGKPVRLMPGDRIAIIGDARDIRYRGDVLPWAGAW